MTIIVGGGVIIAIFHRLRKQWQMQKIEEQFKLFDPERLIALKK